MAGIYVHIPFCGAKCVYCDFYSTVDAHDSFARYIDAVLAEARLRHGELQEPITTLYVGGGTPSVLPIEQLARLVQGLREVFDLSQVVEFTVEVNPDDVTSSLVQALVRVGCNRVSMGIQSFDDGELKFMNRRHTAAQAVNAVRVLREAGIGNLSVDLIYGVPNQSMGTWLANVEQVVALGVPHVSAYSLMYEQGTRLWAMRKVGKVKEIEEELSVGMYQVLVDKLSQAGFEHYEISNFARHGYHSRHNSSYWNLTPYLGLGAAAHSYDGIVRRYNPNNYKSYMQLLLVEGRCAFEIEEMQPWERYDEYVMLRLRTSCGIESADLLQRFDPRFHDFFMTRVQKLNGTSLSLNHSDGRYWIDENKVMLTDEITRELLWEE